MLQSKAASSISSELRAVRAAWLTSFRERFHVYGRSYLLEWTIRPIFDLSIAALIYAGGRTDLAGYVVVAMAANMFLFSSIYYVGEILDRERLKGTLPHLFLAPCSRISWMAGYAGAGAGETLIRVAIVLISGALLFDISYSPNLLTLAVVFPIYLLTLSGLALVLSGIGLLIKRSNALSNLISPIIYLLGGVYFPVAEMPDGLRHVARLLPQGYSMEAITAATLESASLREISSTIWPLLFFAVISPIIGLLTFSYLDTLIRRRGEVDLY